MPPRKPVGLLVDLKDTRPITISSTSDSSSSGHPVARTGAYKKRKIEPTVQATPGTTFTLAQVKEWEMPRTKAAKKKQATKKTAMGVWSEPKGPMIVKYIRAPQRPPTMVNTWLLHGFENKWREEQEAAWEEDPAPLKDWETIEEWTIGVCDALELWC